MILANGTVFAETSGIIAGISQIFRIFGASKQMNYE